MILCPCNDTNKRRTFQSYTFCESHFWFQKMQPTLDKQCNPFIEIKANTADRLFIEMWTFTLLEYAKYQQFSNTYSYSGMIPEPDRNKSPFRDFSPSGSRQMFGVASRDGWATMFSGIVAVFYEPTQGYPNEINFDSITNTQDGIVFGPSILTSSILVATKCKDRFSEDKNCQQTLPQSKFYGSVSNSYTKDFKDVVSSVWAEMQSSKTLSTFPQPVNDRYLKTGFDVSLSFSSVLSLVSTAQVRVTIITTATLIGTTAATIWGQQANIKKALQVGKNIVCCYFCSKH